MTEILSTFISSSFWKCLHNKIEETNRALWKLKEGKAINKICGNCWCNRTLDCVPVDALECRSLCGARNAPQLSYPFILTASVFWLQIIRRTSTYFFISSRQARTKRLCLYLTLWVSDSISPPQLHLVNAARPYISWLHHWLIYFLSFLGKARECSTIQSQQTQFAAKGFTSLQFFLLYCLNFSSPGLPLFLFPWGIQFSACCSTASRSLCKMWRILSWVLYLGS